MHLSHLTRFAALTAVAFGLLAATSAQAELIYGLTTNGQVFRFDSANPTYSAANAATITGTTGYTIAGMDIRPAGGQIYIFGYNEAATTGTNGQLFTLNPITGAATAVGGPVTLAYGLPNSRIGFDFNPQADRIRLIFGDNRVGTGNDANYRLNPNNGVLVATDQSVFFGPNDRNVGFDPLISGAAYTNNVNGATSTTLYAYEFSRQTLVTVTVAAGQATDGQLTSVGTGPSGVVFDDAGMGFDISGVTGTAFLSGRSTGINGLYTVNLATGAATLSGAFTGLPNGVGILDIAAVPEPGTFALIGLAGSALLFARLRRRQA